MKSLAVLPIVALLAACATSNPNLPTQPDVDLARYAGTWYEQAKLPNRFQRDCVGHVQADYVIQPGGTIVVTNQCRTESGETKVAVGEGRLAKDVEPQDTAKLEVRFAPEWTSFLPMVWGDYWILRLEGDYRHSLVGTPDREYLWVLSRDRHADDAVVEQLLAHARTLGFPVDQVTRTPN